MADALRPPTGHVFRVERTRGPAWYAKYRLPDGRQVQKRLGPAWTGRGRPPAGYFTKRLAEDWLRGVLEEARRGTLLLISEERFEEAVDTFDVLIERCRQAGPEPRKRAVLALNNKIAAFKHLGRIDDALACHRHLVEDFGIEALAAFDDTIRRFIDAGEPEQREALAGALWGKAGLLRELNRREEAIAVLTELIDRFDNEEHPVIAHVVASAREGRDHLLEEDAEAE